MEVPEHSRVTVLRARPAAVTLNDATMDILSVREQLGSHHDVAAVYWKSSSTASILRRMRTAFSISLQVTPG
jgi:hypothetical protein